MKKLNEEWKVKKRKSRNKSFKEIIDFSLTNSENENSLAKKVKPSTFHLNYLSNKENTSYNKEENVRRSQRLKDKNENSTIGMKSLIKEKRNASQAESLRTDSVKEIRYQEVSHKNVVKKSITEEEKFNLSKWSLPPAIVQAYKAKNISMMFQWQYECLSMKNVLDGRNLVFSAPTSAGKTLVAEILILKKVTETNKKAIMILPFVSVVREKVHYFQEMFQNAGIVVDGYMGAHNPPGGFKSVDIAICTIEKANNLVNRLMEEKRLNELGILVVDELHMLGDHGRGYLLELLLTKLLYNCKKDNINIQIIGMSATLPNLNVLALWLDSELYHTDYRPVPLQENYKIDNVVYSAKTKEPLRKLNQLSFNIADDSDHTIYLAIETIIAGHGVLIFCPSKNWCENLATSIAKEIFNIGRPNVASTDPQRQITGEKLREHLKGSLLNDILQQLKSSPAGLDSVLGLTVPFGVAYHHAGLTFDERDIIEDAFRQGILKILVATSTLSSGVNLPARRVIIRSPLFFGAAIDVLSYKQMVGRAGRKGIDEEGESILICKESEKKIALSLITSELRPVKSCLLLSGKNTLHSSLKRALIEVVASGAANTRDEVLKYASCTLLYAAIAEEYSEISKTNIENSIDKCLDYLLENDIIFKYEEKLNDVFIVKYKPSQLGLAMLASGFSPDDALRILKELQLARRNFVLENDLHLLYEVTPPYLSDQMGSLNWMHFLSLWEQLPEEYKRVGELVGVQESFIGLGVQGRISKNSYKIIQKLAIHQRFYATLAINDLIQEVPLSAVSEKYDCSRGILQSLQQTMSTFAGMLTIFCNRLKWHNLELLFSHFQRRVHFGIQQELCDLVRLSTLNAQRARALYNAGYETVTSLAAADPEDLTLLLCNMGSFISDKQLDGELAQEALDRYETKRIRIIGKNGVNEKEAANLIIQEAQYFIKKELGIQIISWDNANKNNLKSPLNNKSSDESISLINSSNTVRDLSPKNNRVSSINSANVTENESFKQTSVLVVESSNLFDNSNLNNSNAMQESKALKSNSQKCSKYLSEEETSIKTEHIEIAKNQNLSYVIEECVKELNHLPENELSKNNSVLNVNDKNITNFFENYSTSEHLQNNEDAVDNLTFSEILLSQTAELGDVYFAQTSVFSDSMEFNENNKMLLEDCVKSNENVCSNNIEINDLNENKASIKHFTSVNKSLTLPDFKNSIHSYLNELEMNCLSESFSFNFQNTLKKSNCSFVKEARNNIKRKSFESQNESIDAASKKNFQAHSTPKRDLECDSPAPFTSKMSNIYFHQNQILNKSPILLEKGLVTVNPIKTTSSDSSCIQSEKELSINETSGDIFESEDSHNAEKIPKANCKLTEKLNQENYKSISETSDDLFDEEGMNKICEIFDQKASPIHLQINQSIQKSKLNIKSPTASISLKYEFSKHLIGDKNISVNSGKPVDNINVLNRESNLLLKSDNYSNIWASWTSSPSNTIPLSKIKLSLDAFSTSIEKVNNSQEHRNVSKVPSLTLNSADNSLFVSFTSECLSPTPGVKKGANSVTYKTDISTKQLSSHQSKSSTTQKVFHLPITATDNDSVPQIHSDSNDFPSLKIIDVLDTNLDCFFKKLLEIPTFSLSVACEKLKEKKQTIGPPNSLDEETYSAKNMCIIDQDIIVKGISICYGGPSFYIAFSSESDNCTSSRFEDKRKSIQHFFHSCLQKANVIVYNFKSHFQMLWQGCNISLKSSCGILYFDPSIATWLLDPSDGLQSLKVLIRNYWPEATNFIENLESGLHYWSTISGRQRSSTEAFVIYNLMPKLLNELEGQELHSCFMDIEMPSVLTFAKMEQNGLGFDPELASNYQLELQKKQQDILEKSYKMAKRRFNISSSKDISRVLYKELKLTKGVSPDSPKIQKHLAIDTMSHSRRLPPELKTNKECLEKIIHLHPLPKAILDWRRLSFATTKVLMPLLRKNKFDSFFQMNRLYSTCYVHTLTGRVHMHSPNLQFVPRNFNVENIARELISDEVDKDEDTYDCNDEDISQYGVSLRNLFIPSKGSILLTADYAQLELRILAHLSNDKKLLNSLNCGEDVFVTIASVWKKIPVASISKEMREQAKKICYGIIYGISAKTLSEQLKSSEKEALMFMETFKNSYSDLEIFFQAVIKKCSMLGYITTIAQRRRYLPLIKSTNKSERNHAERQAINTTVQGSAADIVKAAMINIERDMHKEFPEALFPYSFRDLKSLKHKEGSEKFRGGFLVLQMHDELIYEVNERDLETVVKIVKKCMEETTKLSVKLPVKICIGATWGTMKEYS